MSKSKVPTAFGGKARNTIVDNFGFWIYGFELNLTFGF